MLITFISLPKEISSPYKFSTFEKGQTCWKGVQNRFSNMPAFIGDTHYLCIPYVSYFKTYPMYSPLQENATYIHYIHTYPKYCPKFKGFCRGVVTFQDSLLWLPQLVSMHAALFDASLQLIFQLQFATSLSIVKNLHAWYTATSYSEVTLLICMDMDWTLQILRRQPANKILPFSWAVVVPVVASKAWRRLKKQWGCADDLPTMDNVQTQTPLSGELWWDSVSSRTSGKRSGLPCVR